MAREMTGKRHEYFGVLLMLATVLLAACLISYDRRDDSFNVLTYKMTPDNWIGVFGAHISDGLFQLLGLTAFILVVPMAILSWKMLRGKPVRQPYVRTAGLILLICSLCAALQLAPLPTRELGFMPGGVTGVFLANQMLPYLNLPGTIAVVIGGFLLGLLASTRITFEGTYGRLAARKNAARPGYWRRFREWWMNRKKVRAVVNIKTPASPTMELTPRPAPIKPPAGGTATASPVLTKAQPEQADTAPSPPAETPMRPSRKYVLPPTELLIAPEPGFAVEENELMERARQLTEKCAEFDVLGSVTQIHPGPVVTTFEFKPDAGVKYSKITALVDDLCLRIRAESIRIDRIPGKATVGIEVPNSHRETIMLRELIESDVFRRSSSRLTLALGKLINGNVYVTDLTKMPHLLIAGATGAGKSVALNCMITSILYKTTPEEVRFILIDPKRLELGIYKDIPHLLTPIVTDPREAANALRWATSEMETRYRKLALRGVRNIDQYNVLLRSTGRQLSLLEEKDGDRELEYPLPYLVIVIDELADLMMVSSREVEESISRLAAMARAVGIHLILATQRPSVDVITGIIKANFPCRISFKVATKVDSRTIIDSNGAEQLLGNGDMLFIPPGSSRIVRIHGAYVSEKEAQLIAGHLRKQGRPAYDDSVLTYGQEELDEAGNPIDPAAHDPLYNDAVRVVVNEGRASTSLLQRRLSIGYGRAAKLVDMMHQNNIVGPSEGSKPREVLVGLDYLERLELGG